jgi:hypothetical protein
MPESRETSLTSTPRLLAAVALTVALTGAGLTAAKDPAGAAPATGMVPGMATGPATATGSGTPVPTAPTSPSQSPLAPPTDFAVASVTSTSVTFTWTAPVRGDVAGYSIYFIRRFNDVYQGVAVGDVTTGTVTGLTAGWDYTFSLTARDAAGNEAHGANSITVVTPRSDTGPDTTPPSTPAGFRLGPGPTLSWEPATDNVGVTGYEVYWFNGWYASVLVATVTGTSYTPTSVPTSPYPSQFYVRARDAAGNVSIATHGVTASGSATTAPLPPPLVCRVTYSTTAEWRRGFAARLTITNTGQVPLDGWTLAFTFGGDQRITSSRNSTFSQDGADVLMTNVRRNGRLEPGASTTVGMVGSHRYDTTPPQTFRLNDRLCVLG